MDLYKRYIPCKCLQSGNDFIPFWELNWLKSEMYGEGFYQKDQSQYEASYNNLVDCYWDSKDRKIILGQVKDVYPDETKLEHKVGKTVLVELENPYGAYKIDKISEIVYEEYETRIVKVKKLDSYELKWYFAEEEVKSLNKNDLFEIRNWKPYYKTESGLIIKWNHQIKTLVN